MGRRATNDFQKVRDVLSSPLTRILPFKSLALTLYLIFIKKSIGALLAQEVEGVEYLLYYLRKSLQDAELNYPSIETNFLALIFAT